ncbi:MAG: ubiquinone biosynthesis regulatory protein kinase UbiB, partial [Sulfuriflexus sp.]|nr:ubiquinone biosynthesis regulatory protein kinase UbiB [Sulfuriflexus sp.]
LVLLQKTLLNIEGLGRQLYPDLDLWTTAKPFLERWMNEHVGWRGLAKSMRRNAPLMAEKLPELPLLMHEVLDKARNGKLEVVWKSEELTRLRHDMRQNNRRLLAGITGAALIIAAAILMQSADPLISYVSAGLGAAILLMTLAK